LRGQGCAALLTPDMPSLEVFGLRPHHADEIVAKAAKASSMQGNPIALTNDEPHAILAN